MTPFRSALAGVALLATTVAACAETRVLLVGVAAYRHLDESQHLSAPRNDVIEMRDLLIKRGIKRQNITILTDPGKPAERLTASERERLPTRRNIMTALDTLTKSSQRGDFAIVYLSGHGSFQPDQPDGPDRDEEDGLDEVFLPYDVEISSPDGRATNITNGIIDDEFGKVRYRDPRQGCRSLVHARQLPFRHRHARERRGPQQIHRSSGARRHRRAHASGEYQLRRQDRGRSRLPFRGVEPRQGRVLLRRAGEREGRRTAAAALGAARQGNVALGVHTRDDDGARPPAEPHLSRAGRRSERDHARHGGTADHPDRRARRRSDQRNRVWRQPWRDSDPAMAALRRRPHRRRGAARPGEPARSSRCSPIRG